MEITIDEGSCLVRDFGYCEASRILSKMWCQPVSGMLMEQDSGWVLSPDRWISPTGLKTIGHIFVGEKADFYEITDSCPQYEKSSDGGARGRLRLNDRTNKFGSCYED